MDLLVLIHQLQGMLAGRSILGGQGSVTFPGGSPFSSYVTVPHGLGKVPTSIVLTEVNTGVATVAVNPAAITATSFQVRARQADGSSPVAGVQSFFYWQAMG